MRRRLATLPDRPPTPAHREGEGQTRNSPPRSFANGTEWDRRDPRHPGEARAEARGPLPPQQTTDGGLSTAGPRRALATGRRRRPRAMIDRHRREPIGRTTAPSTSWAGKLGPPPSSQRGATTPAAAGSACSTACSTRNTGLQPEARRRRSRAMQEIAHAVWRRRTDWRTSPQAHQAHMPPPIPQQSRTGRSRARCVWSDQLTAR